MDVQDRLAGLDRLADDAVGGAAPPPAGDLWQRGERWQRSRRRGTATIAALGVVVVALVSVLGVRQAAPPEPAVRPGSSPTLPDRVFEISPWEPVATPGEPVVAAQLVTRETWTGEVPAIAVITGSGRYVHLDAPDISGQDGVALAPDGRHVAYWATGISSGSPQTYGGQAEPVTGVDVVDVVTGDVVRHDVDTVHGLSPSALLWADDATLLGAHLQWVAGDDGTEFEQGLADDASAWAWQPAGRSSFRVLDVDALAVDSFAEATGDLLLAERRLVDLASGTSRRVTARSGSGVAGASGSRGFLRGDGTLALVGGPGLGGRSPNRVTIADLSTSPTTQAVVPGTAQSIQVLGWRGERLVVARLPGKSARAGGDMLVEIVAVDVVTGDGEVLADGDLGMLGWAWATDLLDAPVVQGVEPATPMDPREVVVLLGLAALGTLGGMVVWRRRGHP